MARTVQNIQPNEVQNPLNWSSERSQSQWVSGLQLWLRWFEDSAVPIPRSCRHYKMVWGCIRGLENEWVVHTHLSILGMIHAWLLPTGEFAELGPHVNSEQECVRAQGLSRLFLTRVTVKFTVAILGFWASRWYGPGRLLFNSPGICPFFSEPAPRCCALCLSGIQKRCLWVSSVRVGHVRAGWGCSLSSGTQVLLGLAKGLIELRCLLRI